LICLGGRLFDKGQSPLTKPWKADAFLAVTLDTALTGTALAEAGLMEHLATATGAQAIEAVIATILNEKYLFVEMCGPGTEIPNQ